MSLRSVVVTQREKKKKLKGIINSKLKIQKLFRRYRKNRAKHNGVHKNTCYWEDVFMRATVMPLWFVRLYGHAYQLERKLHEEGGGGAEE